MHGLNLAALLIAAALAGAYIALFVRALIAESSDRRVNDAAVASLSPDALEHLRAYLGEIDQHERGRVDTTVERWGRARAAQIAAEEEYVRRGGDPWTPV